MTIAFHNLRRGIGFPYFSLLKRASRFIKEQMETTRIPRVALQSSWKVINHGMTREISDKTSVAANQRKSMQLLSEASNKSKTQPSQQLSRVCKYFFIVPSLFSSLFFRVARTFAFALIRLKRDAKLLSDHSPLIFQPQTMNIEARYRTSFSLRNSWRTQTPGSVCNAL